MLGFEIGAPTCITESVTQPHAGGGYGYDVAMRETKSKEADMSSYGSLNTIVTMSVSFEIKRK